MANEVKNPPIKPAEPPKVPDGVTPQNVETFLEKHGWERAGSEFKDGIDRQLWHDPAASALKNLAPLEVTLPNREGPPTTIKQVRGAPVAWAYSTHEAASIQRQRNTAGGGDGSPIERLTAVEKRNNDLVAALRQVAGQLDALSKKPTPQKPDALEQELRNLKVRLSNLGKEALASVEK